MSHFQPPVNATSLSLEQLAHNVKAALRVAGPDQEGEPSKMRPIDIARNTQMSRTTIRPLLETKKSGPDRRAPNLESVQKMADAIGIPVAFLLMTPSDWRALVAAVTAYSANYQAARQIVGDSMGEVSMAIRVLEKGGVHPDKPPLGQQPSPEQRRTLQEQNEVRRRTTHSLGALSLMAAGGSSEKVSEMLAIAASLGSALTSQHAAAIAAAKNSNYA